MNDAAKNSHGEGFEVEDLSPQGVFYFMAGLAIVGVLIYFIVLGMYRFLDAYDLKHQPPANPMAVTTGVNASGAIDFNAVQGQVEKTFPKPILEYSERTQFTQEVARQDQALESYYWVDQKNGIVHIPIEQAMDLVAERGLPVLPQGEATHGAGAAKPGAASKPGTGMSASGKHAASPKK